INEGTFRIDKNLRLIAIKYFNRLTALFQTTFYFYSLHFHANICTFYSLHLKNSLVGGDNVFPKGSVLKPEVVTLLRLIRTFTFSLRSCVAHLTFKRSVF